MTVSQRRLFPEATFNCFGKNHGVGCSPWQGLLARCSEIEGRSTAIRVMACSVSAQKQRVHVFRKQARRRKLIYFSHIILT